MSEKDNQHCFYRRHFLISRFIIYVARIGHSYNHLRLQLICLAQTIFLVFHRKYEFMYTILKVKQKNKKKTKKNHERQTYDQLLFLIPVPTNACKSLDVRYRNGNRKETVLTLCTFSALASFLAQVVSDHFLVISSFSQTFLTVLVRAEGPILILN